MVDKTAAFVMIVLVMLGIAACGPGSGYRTFKGTDELPVTLEYPSSWRTSGPGTIEDWTFFEIRHDEMMINVDAEPQAGSDYPTAEAVIQHTLDINMRSPDFSIVSRKTRSLGGLEALEIEVSYRLVAFDVHAPKDQANIDKMLAEQHIAVAYRGRIYYIWFLEDLDHLEEIQAVYEHLDDTFRFK